MRIELGEASAQVMVWDGLIKAQVGQPLQGQLRSVNANSYLSGWSIPGVKNDSGQHTEGITFSPDIIRASGVVRVTAKPQGYSNGRRGSGTCAAQ